MICLTEPRLNTFNVQQILASIAPSGYMAIHSPRPVNASHSGGGGLCVLYRASLNVVQQPIADRPTFEVMEFCLTSNIGAVTFVSVIYRLHSSTLTQFVVEMDLYLVDIKSRSLAMGHGLLLVGDWNAPSRNTLVPPTIHRSITLLLTRHHLTQRVTTATRQGNILDLVVSPNTSLYPTVTDITVLDLMMDDGTGRMRSISDHRMVRVKLII